MNSQDLSVIGLGVVASYRLLTGISGNEASTSNRRFWIDPFLRSRARKGFFVTLYPDLLDDETKFFNYTRMTKEQFENLFTLIDPHVVKVSPRKAISTREVLLITLRYLASGNTQTDMMYGYRVGQPTLSKRLAEMTKVVWDVLSPIYVAAPTTEEWTRIAQHFKDKWQVPNCVGAIDGKHCVIRAPEHSGSEYFNYKKGFSLVLLAVVDANYNYLLIDVGAPGSHSDGGIFQRCDFGKDILEESMNLPSDCPLPRETNNFPHYFVADAAFPLRRNLMKPYPGHNLSPEQEHYNDMITRGRRLSENVFGIMANKFQVYHRVMNGAMETVRNVVLCTVALHNYIRRTAQLQEEDPNNMTLPRRFHNIDEENGTEIGSLYTRNRTTQAKMLRDQLMRYFNR